MTGETISVREGPSALANWWALAILTLISTLGIVVHYLISMLVGGMRSDLGLTDFQMGTAMGPAFGLPYALGGLALGWACDRYSRRWVLFGGVIVFGLAHAATGLAQNFETVLILRILTALGAAAVAPAAVSIVTERFGRGKLTTAIAILSTANKLGLAITFALGGALLAWGGWLIGRYDLAGMAPWRLVFLTTGVPSALLGLLVLTFADEREGKAPAAALAPVQTSIFAFIRDEWRLLSLMLGGFTLVACCTQGFIAWVPAFMERKLHQDPLSYGSVLGLFSTLAAAMLIVKGMIMDRLYARGMRDVAIRFYTWLLIASFPCAIFAFLTTSYPVFFLCYFVVAVLALPFAAYVLSAAMTISPPHLRGQMSALVKLPIFAIGGAGPMLMGWLTDNLFRDKDAIGYAIAIVVGVLIPLGVLCLRRSLVHFEAAAARAEARNAAAVPAAGASPTPPPNQERRKEADAAAR